MLGAASFSRVKLCPVMRDLIPFDENEVRRSRWKCDHCERVFQMSSDYIADTSSFPPVHVWIAFEQHRCRHDCVTCTENPAVA